MELINRSALQPHCTYIGTCTGELDECYCCDQYAVTYEDIKDAEVIEAIPTTYAKAIIDSFAETMNHKAANRTASMYADYEMGVIDTYMEVIRQLYGLIKGEYEEKSYVDNV